MLYDGPDDASVLATRYNLTASRRDSLDDHVDAPRVVVEVRAAAGAEDALRLEELRQLMRHVVEVVVGLGPLLS